MTLRLTPQFARGALRRGAEVEQLGNVTLLEGGTAVVEYYTLSPRREGGVALLRHRVLDEVWPDVGDLGEYPPVDEEDAWGEELAVYGDAQDALSSAASYGLGDDRWVNCGLVPLEYEAARRGSS